MTEKANCPPIATDLQGTTLYPELVIAGKCEKVEGVRALREFSAYIKSDGSTFAKFQCEDNLPHADSDYPGPLKPIIETHYDVDLAFDPIPPFLPKISQNKTAQTLADALDGFCRNGGDIAGRNPQKLNGR